MARFFLLFFFNPKFCLFLENIHPIMAVDIIFRGTEQSDDQINELQVTVNSYNEIQIEVRSPNNYTYICLDRMTAIKLHKELKRQISYIQTENI